MRLYDACVPPSAGVERQEKRGGAGQAEAAAAGLGAGGGGGAWNWPLSRGSGLTGQRSAGAADLGAEADRLERSAPDVRSRMVQREAEQRAARSRVCHGRARALQGLEHADALGPHGEHLRLSVELRQRDLVAISAKEAHQPLQRRPCARLAALRHRKVRQRRATVRAPRATRGARLSRAHHRCASNAAEVRRRNGRTGLGDGEGMRGLARCCAPRWRWEEPVMSPTEPGVVAAPSPTSPTYASAPPCATAVPSCSPCLGRALGELRASLRVMSLGW